MDQNDPLAIHSDLKIQHIYCLSVIPFFQIFILLILLYAEKNVGNQHVCHLLVLYSNFGFATDMANQLIKSYLLLLTVMPLIQLKFISLKSA